MSVSRGARVQVFIFTTTATTTTLPAINAHTSDFLPLLSLYLFIACSTHTCILSAPIEQTNAD